MMMSDLIKKGVKDPRQAASYLRNLTRENVYTLYAGGFLSLSSRHLWGTNVFQRDWDLLIVLDACRVDALQSVTDEYDWLHAGEDIRSVASTSPVWMAKTFDQKWEAEIARTTYLSANPFTKRVLDDRLFPEDYMGVTWTPTTWNPVTTDEFNRVEHLWKYAPTGVSTERGDPKQVTPPDYVTEWGIKIGREVEFDRLILHYMQPHAPYLANASDRELVEREYLPWRYLHNGGDRQKVWESYLDNLKYVLDNVEDLINNIDAENTVITADHGEAFGEWGMYGHGAGKVHPCIRRVPWVELSAEDTASLDPSPKCPSDTNGDVDDQLEALGYR